MQNNTEIAAASLSGDYDGPGNMPAAGGSPREIRARQEALLDAAVQETFPASDAVAVMRLF